MNTTQLTHHCTLTSSFNSNNISFSSCSSFRHHNIHIHLEVHLLIQNDEVLLNSDGFELPHSGTTRGSMGGTDMGVHVYLWGNAHGALCSVWWADTGGTFRGGSDGRHTSIGRDLLFEYQTGCWCTDQFYYSLWDWRCPPSPSISESPNTLGRYLMCGWTTQRTTLKIWSVAGTALRCDVTWEENEEEEASGALVAPSGTRSWKGSLHVAEVKR